MNETPDDDPSRISDSTPSKTYHVPRQFGIGAMMGITTLFALICGIFRSVNAPAQVIVFFAGLFALAIAAQFVFPNSPRFSSSCAGTILLMIWVTYLLIEERQSLGRFLSIRELFFANLFASIFGFVSGYFAGTFSASVFMFGDMFDNWLGRDRTDRDS